MKQFIILVLSVYLIGIIFFIGVFYYQLKPVTVSAENQNQSIQFIVEKGSGFKEIAENLENQNLIKSAQAFKMYLLIKGWANKLQPGIYQINYGAKPVDIAKTLLLGMPNEKTIVIPEGYTLLNIENKLKSEGVLNENESLFDLKIADFQNEYDFLKDSPADANLEGFLFPDTYRFKINSPPTLIATRMLDNFEKNISNLSEEIKNSSLNFYQIIILASIIEGEVPDEKDRPLVAGILLKRMENKMPLQVDASIIYYKCNILKTDDCRKISPDDLKTDSSYNTYKNKGLPKGPINNPGLSAIKAALNPLDSPYWYYLSDPQTGNTIFSKTLKEHNQAIKQYLK